VLFAILIIAIAVNSYYINSVSTELLDMIFALPSEYNYIINLDAAELEDFKTKINKIEAEWEKNAHRICAVTRYSDFERTNSCVYNLKAYFFSEDYSEYLAARKRLITALEKQKVNEMPNLENIF
jgi:hypothetical protein